jgi:drug/metabolite transporter (DMT)-like permease
MTPVALIYCFLCLLGTAVVVWGADKSGDTIGSVSQQNFFWMAGYGISNIGLGLCVYFWGVARTTVISAVLVTLTQIPIAPIWTWILHDESVGWWTIAGGMIMLAAAIIYLLTDGGLQIGAEAI